MVCASSVSFQHWSSYFFEREYCITLVSHRTGIKRLIDSPLFLLTLKISFASIFSDETSSTAIRGAKVVPKQKIALSLPLF